MVCILIGGVITWCIYLSKTHQTVHLLFVNYTSIELIFKVARTVLCDTVM